MSPCSSRRPTPTISSGGPVAGASPGARSSSITSARCREWTSPRHPRCPERRPVATNQDQVTFGLAYDFRNPEQWKKPYESLYRETLDQIAWAENLGFRSVWLTEHHFCDDGYTPSPLVVAAGIGARTQHMRIGTNLIVLPLHDPMRIAEDAATVSILTGGRFLLGVGQGYHEAEFEGFGRKLRNRPSLLEEGIEIIRRAWT